MSYKTSARQAGKIATARAFQEWHKKNGHSSPSHKDCAICQNKAKAKSKEGGKA